MDHTATFYPDLRVDVIAMLRAGGDHPFHGGSEAFDEHGTNVASKFSSGRVESLDIVPTSAFLNNSLQVKQLMGVLPIKITMELTFGAVTPSGKT